ncbi:MAG: hypothetical protein KC492_00070, partial [Myxococcales bacterium]|nr:hypothetical protein [Myxococcales bacterium]
ISLKPPTEQAAELRDLLDALAKIDNEVAPEEQLILDELLGMLNAYALPDGATAQTYRVVLVPQGAAQDDAIKSLLPAVAKTEYRGGEAYVAGSYFSGNYASMICRRYRAMNLFTIVDRSEPASASN